MLVIENCNSLSDLRQKLIDGEEVRTAKQGLCEDVIRREDAINAVSEALEHVFVEHEDIAKKMINKLPSVKPQEPCDNAISRQWLMKCVNEGWIKFDTEKDENRFIHLVRDIAPSVTPQPKTGHWIRELIRNEKGGCIGAKMICSECGNDNKHDEYMIYCPNCGAKMDERREVRYKV